MMMMMNVDGILLTLLLHVKLSTLDILFLHRSLQFTSR